MGMMLTNALTAVKHQQLAAAKTPHDRTVLEAQIAAADRQTDALVYELYGLTADEIKIVEEGRER